MAESPAAAAKRVAATQIGSVGPLIFDEIRHQFELRNSAADHIEKRHCSSCPTIKNAVLRYHREYDRYLKLSARVAEICRFEIVEGNAIRAQVTFRAKSPKSLEGKLRRFAASGKKDLPNVQSVFDEVRDLAAVRIATYEQRHEDQVVQLVCKRFVDLKGATPSSERKDKNAADNNNFYRATHIEAFLPEADVIGTYANVSDVPCEVQVCSMMAHVWNEIEHDLGYKPVTGSLSEQEYNLLKSLGLAVRQGDQTIGLCLRKPSDDNAPTAAYSRMSTISSRESAGGFRISILVETQARYTKRYNQFVSCRRKASAN